MCKGISKLTNILKETYLIIVVQRHLAMACGVVVSMFDFHRSDRGSNPGRGGEFS